MSFYGGNFDTLGGIPPRTLPPVATNQYIDEQGPQMTQDSDIELILLYLEIVSDPSYL